MKTKRILIFTVMFILFIPDIIWCLFNLIQAGIAYFLGYVLEKSGIECGKAIKMYGLNIAISIDQFAAVKAMGQDSDVTISMALGVAKMKHELGLCRVSRFWLCFGAFVNILFGFQEDHVKESIEIEETAQNTVIHLYVDCKKLKEDKTSKAA